MKKTRLLTLVVFAFVIGSGILITSAIRRSETVEPSDGAREPSGTPGNRTIPENVTVIPPEAFEPIPFRIFLRTRRVEVSKGQSVNLNVTIHSTEDVDLLLRVGPQTHVPASAPEYAQPEFPSGIIAYLSQTEKSVEADSETTVTLTLSVENQTMSGTYTIQISALQRTSYVENEVLYSFNLDIP